MNGFSLSGFVDSLDDDYGVFDDVADSLNFAAVGIDTSAPVELLTVADRNIAETNKKKNAKVYGMIPYGFGADGSSLIPNPKEQKTLKKITSLKGKGLSYAKISDFLNRNKYTKRNGSKFSRYDVVGLMKTNRDSISV